MNKKIEFQYEGKNYCLEYDRTSIQYMESIGFDLNSIGKMPATMVEIMFQGAFLKNHKKLTRDRIKEIYESLNNKTELMNALIEMVSETYNSMFDTDEEEVDSKNQNWKIV